MIDILVYSESQKGIQDMVNEFSPKADVRYDWMPPGTMLLRLDDPNTPEEDAEYDEDNWYCNLRFLDDNIAQSILWEAEAAFDAGQVMNYPSQRQPGVNHSFPWLNRGYDENVIFIRKEDGSYVPSWPRRMWAGGLRTE